MRTGHTYSPRAIRNSVPGKLNRAALSPREMDILRLIVRGLSNQEIADALNITRGTVKWHANIILLRLRTAVSSLFKAVSAILISNRV